MLVLIPMLKPYQEVVVIGYGTVSRRDLTGSVYWRKEIAGAG